MALFSAFSRAHCFRMASWRVTLCLALVLRSLAMGAALGRVALGVWIVLGSVAAWMRMVVAEAAFIATEAQVSSPPRLNSFVRLRVVAPTFPDENAVTVALQTLAGMERVIGIHAGTSGARPAFW